ncbi:DUF5134 domain-containing protein [Streptomyces sp. NPDC001020]
MHGPTAPGWLLVALCAASGAYCLLRMRSTVEEQRRDAGGEALMGFGMAVMAVPAAVAAPPRWAWIAYLVIFGSAAVRALFAARTHAHHLVGAFAMVYMAGSMVSSPGHHGHGGVPLLTGVFLLYFAGYVLWAGVRLVPVAAVTGAGAGATRSVGWGDRPELTRACRLSMTIGMLAMLLSA